MKLIAKGLLERCDVLAQFSEVEGQLTRTFLSEPVHAVQKHLSDWMQALDMRVRLDAVGNLIGRYQSASVQAKTLLIGSHFDTVRNAGKYDGILGILMGLAAVEQLQGQALPLHLEVVAFSEEEGVRFGVPFIGSKAFVGALHSAMLELRDAQGISVAEAIRAFGLEPAEIPKAAIDPQSYLGFLEVHIEQGPRLAALKQPVGIVSTIAGSSRVQLSFTGTAGHAGASPMHLRQDALTGAAELILEAERYAQSIPELVATVGKLTVQPGAINVIPARVELSLDVRHGDDGLRLKATEALHRFAETLAKTRGLKLDWQELMNQAAVPMDASLQQRLLEAAGETSPVIPSGAGHDAMIMAETMPAAMLFIRSPNGISHNPAEMVLAEDVERGLEVVVGFIERLAAQYA